MTDIPFVDAHVHFWDLKCLPYPWLSPPFSEDGPNGSVAAIARDYRYGDYRTDVAGVDIAGVVHVEAGADAAAAIEETAWLEEQSDATGLATAIVAFAALDDAGVEGLLERQAAYPRVRGIRHIVNWHADPRRTYTSRDVTQNEAWHAGYGLLGRYGLSFDLQCYPGQMVGLASLIARHEDVPVFINHLGMPVIADSDGVAQWRTGMRALAAMSHVHVKISGFGFIDRSWTIDRVRPFVDEAIALFGPDRSLFASDMPTDKLFAPAERCVTALDTLASGFSDDERRAMWGRNANRAYRLGLDL